MTVNWQERANAYADELDSALARNAELEVLANRLRLIARHWIHRHQEAVGAELSDDDADALINHALPTDWKKGKR